MTSRRTYRVLLSLVVAVMFLSGIATPTMSIAKSYGEQDSVSQHKLVIHDTMQARYRYTDALKKFLIERDTAAAITLLDKSLAVDSMYAPAFYQKASIEFGRDKTKAVEYARKAYEIDTMNRWYAALYAQTLALTENYDEALYLYRRLMKLDTKNPDHYRIVAILYQQRQQPYAAISVLDSADMRFGKNPYMTDLKRHLLLATRQYDRAIEEAQQAVDIAPYDQKSLLDLGTTYAAAGRDSLAQTTIQQAFKMDSTNIEAITTYADFLFSRKNISGYMSVLQILFRQKEYPLQHKLQLIERFMENRDFYGDNYFSIGNMALALNMLYPTDPRTVNIYGEHLLAGGFVENSLQFFKQHLDDKPAQLDYYMAVIDLEEYLQRPDSMDRYVARAMDIFAENPVLYIRKANRQYIKGDLHGAIGTFEKAMTLASNDTMRGELWGYIGDTYHQIAERATLKRIKADTLTKYPIKMSEKAAMKRCYKAYEQALALYPGNASVLNNYAYFLSEEERDLEHALAMASQAIHLEKMNATYLDTYAWILYLLGRAEEAQGYMRQALSLDRTKSPELPLHYGDILYKLGNNFLAEIYWRKALELGGDKQKVEERMQMLKAQKAEPAHQQDKGLQK